LPITTALTHVHSLLENLSLPGFGGSTLLAVIDPPDPETEQQNAVAYVWPTAGDEKRQSSPRPQQGTPGTGSTQAGHKQMEHRVDVWLIWWRDQGDLTPSISFPVIVDAVMDAMRCSLDAAYNLQDPVTFRYSTLFSIGEKMAYEIAPPRTALNQRSMVYEGLVRVIACEEFQA